MLVVKMKVVVMVIMVFNVTVKLMEPTLVMLVVMVIALKTAIVLAVMTRVMQKKTTTTTNKPGRR